MNRRVYKKRTDEYTTWRGMKERCYRKTAIKYHRYGGRGITVCERWRASFKAFLADMGPRPSSLHSLDRINNDGNYEPENCRWVTRIEQARNTVRNLIVTIDGISLCAAEWAQRSGIDVRTIRRRIHQGVDPKTAVFTPSGGLRQNQQNARLKPNNTSGFRGVSWDKKNKRWTARIGSNGRHFALGRYKVKEDAARAYDQGALRLGVKFPQLNFPQA